MENNNYPKGTRQLILKAHCDDEYVDPQPEYAIVTLTQEKLVRWWELMGVAEDICKRVGDDFYRFSMFDSTAQFVGATDENELYLLVQEHGLPQDRYEIALLPMGRELTPAQIKELQDESGLQMDVPCTHFGKESVMFSAYTKHSNAYCTATEIEASRVLSLMMPAGELAAQ